MKAPFLRHLLPYLVGILIVLPFTMASAQTYEVAFEASIDRISLPPGNSLSSGSVKAGCDTSPQSEPLLQI